MAFKKTFQCCSTFVLPGESDPARTDQFMSQFKDFMIAFSMSIS